MRIVIAAALTAMLATPAAAEFKRVIDRDTFVALLEDRDLTRFGIRVSVADSGKIIGRAFGQRVSGDWNWASGFFCRDLYLNGEIIDGDNCQTVEVRGNTMRFTSDMGTGDYADLRLR